jgi:hypothetical protein
MAKHSQQQQEASANEKDSVSGGRQAVAELCEITSCGLVFWSRQRFDIGAEMQVRIKRSALTPAMLGMTATHSEWVMLKCLVAADLPQRRTDGSSGFKVSLLVVQALADNTPVPKFRSKMLWSSPPLHSRRRFGLN